MLFLTTAFWIFSYFLMPELLGWIYLIGSLLLSSGFIFFAWQLLNKVDIDGAKTLYLYSLLYLALVYVLLMVDSCFSGSLMRGGELSEENETIDKKYIERLKKKKTRLVITSGGNEPVVDSDGGNHSLFALKLIDTLKNNDNVINSQILFENIRRYVVANADQTPERAMVHKTGHDGGDFLFFPK